MMTAFRKTSLSKCFGLALFFLFGALPCIAQPYWPHDRSDLPVDEQVVWGSLDNGLRYAILPHNEPPGRVSMRLYVEAGSLHETDSQRGLAHFLEHMAFNGTKHFEPEEMVQYFQRLGMAFGADTNAHTSFGETVYKLELPESNDALLDDSFLVLRDYADGMLLKPEEIEKERGIILAEKRSRDSVGYRTMEAYYDFLFPQALLSKRLPIGIEEVIANAPRQEFTQFYQTWYRPDNMVLVVVGDVEVPSIREKIEATFGSMEKPETPVPAVEMGSIMTQPVRTRVHQETEAEAADVSIMSLAPYAEAHDSQARRAKEIRQAAAEYIVNRRLERRAKEEGAPFSRGSTYTYNYMEFFTLAGVDVVSRPEDWQAALAEAEHLLRQALQYGFTEAEAQEAKAEILNTYEQAVSTAPSRKSRELSTGIVRSLRSRRVWTTPEADLELARRVLDKTDASALHATFRESWDRNNRELFVSGNLPENVSEDKLLAAYQDAKSVAVEPPKAEETPAFAYQDFGQPGAIVTENTVEAIDVQQAVFTNKVALNFKQTDFEAGKIRVGVRFGRGMLELPEGKPELMLLANQVFTAGGLQAHSQDELQRIFAGKTVGVGFSVSEDAFTLNGLTNADDLNAQLQLMAAYLVAPGFREEALRQARKTLPEVFIQAQTTVEGVLANEVSRFLHGGDPRFGLPTQEAAQNVSMEQLQGWMQRALETGALEVSIVGDVDYETARQAVAQTFGALPERRKAVLPLEESRVVRFPRNHAGKTSTFTVDTRLDRAAVAVYWPTVSTQNIHTARRLGLLSDVFSDRLRVRLREELGEAYSPYSYNRPSDVWKDYGYFTAFSIAQPASAETVEQALLATGADLAQGTVTSDELERAKKPILNMLEEYQRNNAYWLGRVLMGSTVRPEQLQWAETIQPDYAAITTEELNQVAQKYLQPKDAVRVQVVPNPPEDEKISGQDSLTPEANLAKNAH